MEQSILNSTKKILGIGPADTAFDLDVLTHVNSSFATLLQLGVGEHDNGFMIEDDQAEWADFFGPNPHLAQVKTYVYLKTRMLFDPPTSGYAITAMEKQISELEWRLNELREQTEWNDPDPHNPELPEDPFEDPVVIDGGDA